MAKFTQVQTEDTIVAIATPGGRGGLGVVRLSGSQAIPIAGRVLRAARRTASGVPSPGQSPQLPASCFAPWRIQMAELADEQGTLLDRVLVSSFRKPHSYTAEDVVEISCHGSPVLLRFLLEQLLRAGARLAEPGEFTMRAFLHGRIDLPQAEAVRDLIEAQTLYQAKVAAQQMEGAISHWLAQPKQELVELIAQLEAGIDFAEDDVSFLSDAQIAARIGSLERFFSGLAQSFQAAKVFRQGLTLAVVGRPNVGKSSLFNCLLEQDRSIVTALPGTTRDLVSETAEIEGIPLRFVDTAGVRSAFDEAEAIGVRKSLEAAADSDLTLLVLDASAGIQPQDRELAARLYGTGKLLVAANKCDLPPAITPDQMRRELACAASDGCADGPPVVMIEWVSALQRTGVERLRRAIVQAAAPCWSGGREPQFLTNIRHAELVQRSSDALAKVRQSLAEQAPHEVLLLHLYGALRQLDSLTGQTTVDDVLQRIFSTFCIGK